MLFNEAQMDSVNLKYLRFNLLFSLAESYESKFALMAKELERDKLQIQQLSKDKTNLNQQLDKKSLIIDKNEEIFDNKILYWKEKAKGKLTMFLLGTSIGALIVAILTSL